MGLHHEHNHAKAFHHLEARKLMELEERDNKDFFIHLGGKRDENKDNNDDENVVTVTKKVYVTEPKTFPGPAVYVTKLPVTITEQGNAGPTTMNSYESAKSIANQYRTRTPSYAGDGFSPTAVKGTPLDHPEYTAPGPRGMSSGEKAGLAIGILAALGLVAGLLLFCVRRKKKQLENRGEKLDEKHASKNSFFSGTAAAVGAPAGDKRASVKSFNSTHSASTAPRLSLRPVASFLPGFLEKRKSNNDNLAVPAMSEKPRSGSPQNPFADRRSPSPSGNPFDDGDGKALNTPNHSAKPSWESDGTPKVGTAAAVPVAGAGPRSGSNNVHRIQLDFKPSMDDELELKSGQLVRMLHEYDDGWALCIRMDRSQQGVCPRTCLSKLPVKPRPQGAPRPGAGSPPGFRGPPPQGPNKMMPRPLTPTSRERSNTAGGRASSPTPSDPNRNNRSQSVSAAADRAVSPVDSGVPARKPLPDQAV